MPQLRPLSSTKYAFVYIYIKPLIRQQPSFSTTFRPLLQWSLMRVFKSIFFNKLQPWVLAGYNKCQFLIQTVPIEYVQ